LTIQESLEVKKLCNISSESPGQRVQFTSNLCKFLQNCCFATRKNTN